MTRAGFLKRLDAARSRIEMDMPQALEGWKAHGYLEALRDVEDILRGTLPYDRLKCWRLPMDEPNAARRVAPQEGRDDGT